MKEKIRQYVELTKPKVTLLNLFVGVACFLMAAFPSVNPLQLLIFCVAGYLACGGCGVLNCVYEKDIDKLMPRTSKRAIPSGAIRTTNGLLFGAFLICAGLVISYVFFNFLTTFMMILGAFSYLVVYTLILKRSTSLNVVIGGIAGCFAALSGWTAVANSISLLPLLVSMVDFLWTPGHLWGLAIKKVVEYKNAGIPMLPVKAGLKKAGQITFAFNVSAIFFSLLLFMLGLAGMLYLIIAASAGFWFLLESRRLLAFPSGKAGFRIFLASMPYLAVLMTGLIADKVISAGL